MDIQKKNIVTAWAIAGLAILVFVVFFLSKL